MIGILEVRFTCDSNSQSYSDRELNVSEIWFTCNSDSDTNITSFRDWRGTSQRIPDTTPARAVWTQVPNISILWAVQCGILLRSYKCVQSLPPQCPVSSTIMFHLFQAVNHSPRVLVEAHNPAIKEGNIYKMKVWKQINKKETCYDYWTSQVHNFQTSYILSYLSW